MFKKKLLWEIVAGYNTSFIEFGKAVPYPLLYIVRT